MKRTNKIFIAIYVFIFIFIFLACLSHCTYYITGDSVVYMNWLSYLRSGEYFSNNWQALTSSTVKNICLTTEGGYIFILWLSSLINRNLPFFISSLFISCMLLTLSLLIIVLDKSFKRGILTALISIIYIFSFTGITEELMMLNLCLRDGSAHFLGFLGLLLCCIGIKKGYIKKYILTGGVLIGLASWCRVPNILFAIPVGVYALSNLNKKCIKSFFYGIATIFIAIFIGLLPLLLQNTLEGKPFYKPGQTNALVSSNSENHDIEQYNISSGVLKAYSQKVKKHHYIGVQKGLSLANFSSVNKAIVITIYILLKGINLYLVLFCIIIAIIINYRSAITLLSGFFAFFLFYSCYDKVIIRYILVCFLMLIPIISTVIAEFLVNISNKLSTSKEKSSTYYQIILSFFTIILISKIFPYYNGFNDIKNSRLCYNKNRDAIKQLKLHEDDYFMCADKSYKIWTQYSSEAKSFSWQWSSSPHFDALKTNMQQLEAIKNLINNGTRIFFFEIEGGSYPYKYWSKLDMSLYYDLEEKMRIDKATPAGENIIIYELRQRHITKIDLTIPITEDSCNSDKLFVWAEDASGKVPSEQDVIISSGKNAFTNSLHCGLNLYQLPNEFLHENNIITITSMTNLPVVVSTSTFSTNLIVNLEDFEKMGATVRTVKGTSPIFFDNLYSWAREIKPPKGVYRKPLIAIGQSTELNIYNGLFQNINLNLNISTFAESRTRDIFNMLQNINFTYNNIDIKQEMKRIKWDRKYNTRYMDVQITHYDLTNSTSYRMFGDFSNCSSNLPVFLESIEIQLD